MIDFDEKIKQFEEKYELEHNIFCPHCNQKQDMETMYEGHVTYWGEDGANECTCDSCGKVFMVVEIVDRTFKTTTKEVYNSGEDWQ